MESRTRAESTADIGNTSVSRGRRRRPSIRNGHNTTANRAGHDGIRRIVPRYRDERGSRRPRIAGRVTSSTNSTRCGRFRGDRLRDVEAVVVDHRGGGYVGVDIGEQSSSGGPGDPSRHLLDHTYAANPRDGRMGQADEIGDLAERSSAGSSGENEVVRLPRPLSSRVHGRGGLVGDRTVVHRTDTIGVDDPRRQIETTDGPIEASAIESSRVSAEPTISPAWLWSVYR